MSKKIKGKEIYDIVESMLDDKDEETGKTYRELIALQIVKTAAGKNGGSRETINAALSIVDKLSKRPKVNESEYLKRAHDKTKLIEKYKVDYDE